MKTRLKFFLPLIIAAVSLTSCSDDDTVVDTQRPEITLIEPHNEDEFAPGNEFHFEALFTDNVELASYKIEIHEDFDDHTHSVLKSTHDSNPWSYSQVFQIPAGQRSFEAVHHIEVPSEINGMPISEGAYHLGVYVTDRAGNEEQAFVDIHIDADHTGEHDH